jgi:ribosomal protein S12 methylthiotransferase
LIRGEQNSKLVNEVREEAEYLASCGVTEITLIAQDTTKYGLDNYRKLMLPELIETLDQIEGIHWIRILYMYPDEITEELLQAMKKSSKVLPYFDIPMQHANNRLLKLMNRRGTKEETKKLCARIRELFPEAVLRTTAIVGFPSESEEDFQELLDFIGEIGWDRLGAFTYSPEEDTPASRLPQDVDEATAASRLDRLMARQKEISQERNKRKVGTKIEVLVEEQDALTGQYHGRSIADAPDEVDGEVIFTSAQMLRPGQYVPVRITNATQYDLIGIYEG